MRSIMKKNGDVFILYGEEGTRLRHARALERYLVEIRNHIKNNESDKAKKTTDPMFRILSYETKNSSNY